MKQERVPTPDEVIKKYGLDKRPAKPHLVERPELNPDHGPVHELPKEHMIPLEKAAAELDKKGNKN